MQLSHSIDFEQLVAALPGLVHWVDKNNVYLGCNELQALVLGLHSRNDIIGKKNRDLNHRTPEIYDNQNLDVMNKKTPQVFEELVTLSDGTYAMILSHKIPLFDTTGQVIGLLAVSFDTVIQKDIEKTAAKADKEDEELDSQIRILLVEDQIFTAEVTKIILSELNCEVDVANSAKMAMVQAKSKKFDLIFMDIGLPDLDGYATTQWIRHNSLSLNKRVPIIALTALADNQDKERCMESGMNAILIKPIYKNKALDILHAFIPRISDKAKVPIAANDETDWSVLSGKIIDLELGSQMFNGNVELTKKMISTLIVNLSTELTALESSYKAKDWEKMENIVHRLRGAISYCGTPRLQEACARLENHLRAGYRELAPLLYKQLLKEIDAVKHEYALLIG